MITGFKSFSNKSKFIACLELIHVRPVQPSRLEFEFKERKQDVPNLWLSNRDEEQGARLMSIPDLLPTIVDNRAKHCKERCMNCSEPFFCAGLFF
ncbi:hypothetical protein Bca4012_018734 [Brassica carinata]